MLALVVFKKLYICRSAVFASFYIYDDVFREKIKKPCVVLLKGDS